VGFPVDRGVVGCPSGVALVVGIAKEVPGNRLAVADSPYHLKASGIGVAVVLVDKVILIGLA